MLDALYTADEMKAAEAGHDVDELMARAGRAVAVGRTGVSAVCVRDVNSDVGDGVTLALGASPPHEASSSESAAVATVSLPELERPDMPPA